MSRILANGSDWSSFQRRCLAERGVKGCVVIGSQQIGDQLILTKPLGVGLITTALKRGLTDPAHVEAAVKSMSTLNRHAAHLAQRFQAHACTDITGFGILGHGLEMANASQIMLRLRFDDLSLLPGAIEYAEREIFRGGLIRNRDFVLPQVRFAGRLTAAQRAILYDPETSGGLLIALDPDQARSYAAQAKADGIDARIIGQVTTGVGIEIV